MTRKPCCRDRLAAALGTALAAFAAAGPAMAGDIHCSYERTLRSENSNTPVVLNFINTNTDFNDSLTIYWIDYQGKRVKYKSLNGTQAWTVNTYVTHPWVVARPNWEAQMLCEEIILPKAPVDVRPIGGYPNYD